MMHPDAAMEQHHREQRRRGGRTMAVTTAMDQALQSAVVAGTGPGVVALAADDSGVIYQGAYGSRAAGIDGPMTRDSVFGIESMTKAVPSVSAMQLVEQVNLALDGPIGPRLSALASPRVLEGF